MVAAAAVAVVVVVVVFVEYYCIRINIIVDVPEACPPAVCYTKLVMFKEMFTPLAWNGDRSNPGRFSF